MSFIEDFDRWFRRVMKLFEEMEKEFLREFELIEKEFREMERGGKILFGRPRYYVYGFEITIGPDGKPRIREFGNIRPRMVEEEKPRIEVQEEIEPLYDIIEEKDKIKVVVDMPGVNKEDIKVRVTEDGRKLIISARSEERSYYKEIDLPAEVDPTKARATYRNGVLTVELEKKSSDKKGVDIKVE